MQLQQVDRGGRDRRKQRPADQVSEQVVLPGGVSGDDQYGTDRHDRIGTPVPSQNSTEPSSRPLALGNRDTDRPGVNMDQESKTPAVFQPHPVPVST
ncbi:hypothetical protein [Micromonospora marina]|uniref:hypothetical protein n=1 Tax=Micromonospora marina TaxID=307120 RepID=UPI003D71013C